METDSYGDLSFFVFFLENIWWKQKLSVPLQPLKKTSMGV